MLTLLMLNSSHCLFYFLVNKINEIVYKHSDHLAHDCFELGRISYNDRDYYHTLMWMQEALNRMKHEDPPTAVEADILEYLGFALYQQG